MLRLTKAISSSIRPTSVPLISTRLSTGFSSASDSLEADPAFIFPGAMTGQDWLEGIRSVVHSDADASKNGIILFSSQCRDELMSNMTKRLESTLNASSFATHGLAGHITMGPVAWGAGLAHVPGANSTDVSPKVAVVVNTTHIGITADGTVGACSRPGIPVPEDGSSVSNGACGALHVVLNNYKSPPGPIEENPEFNMLHAALTKFDSKTPADIKALTTNVEKFLWKDTAEKVRAAIKGKDFKVILFCGLSVHTHDVPSWGDEYAIWQSVDAKDAPVAYKVIHSK